MHATEYQTCENIGMGKTTKLHFHSKELFCDITRLSYMGWDNWLYLNLNVHAPDLMVFVNMPDKHVRDPRMGVAESKNKISNIVNGVAKLFVSSMAVHVLTFSFQLMFPSLRASYYLLFAANQEQFHGVYDPVFDQLGIRRCRPAFRPYASTWSSLLRLHPRHYELSCVFTAWTEFTIKSTCGASPPKYFQDFIKRFWPIRDNACV